MSTYGAGWSFRMAGNTSSPDIFGMRKSRSTTSTGAGEKCQRSSPPSTLPPPESALCFQQSCKPGAHDRMIVHNQDSYRILLAMLFHAAATSCSQSHSAPPPRRKQGCGSMARTATEVPCPGNCECVELRQCRQPALHAANAESRRFPCGEKPSPYRGPSASPRPSITRRN